MTIGIVRGAIRGALGLLASSFGATVFTWQYWAIFGLVVALQAMEHQSARSHARAHLGGPL